jgi:hypothetical protein
MEKIKDGGPAFPGIGKTPNCFGGFDAIDTEGMTLRDYFAGQALAGLTSDNKTLTVFRDEGTGSVITDAAAASYAYADAMLAAREGKP